jgi:hypothetical protein
LCKLGQQLAGQVALQVEQRLNQLQAALDRRHAQRRRGRISSVI